MAAYLVFRITHWAHFLLLPLVAWHPNAAARAQLLPLGRGVVIAFFLLAFGYLINGYSDRGTGSQAHKALALGGVRRPLFAVLAIQLVVALALAATGPPVVWIATGLCAVSGVLYSVGLRLKAYPVLGSVTNLTNFAPLMFLGMTDLSLTRHTGPLVVTFAVLLMQNQILHEAADQAEDSAQGVRTTFRWLGPAAASVLTAALGLGVATTLFLVPSVARWWLGGGTFVVFGTAAPWMLYQHGRQPTVLARVRVAHRYLSLLTGAAVFLLLRVW